MERTRETKALLAAAGCEVIATLPLDRDMKGRMPNCHADLLLASVDRPTEELFAGLSAVQSAKPLPMVVLSADDDAETVRHAVESGVCAYVVDGVQPDRLQPILIAAMARFQRMRSLHEELDRTRAQLSERKLIERAKGIVMAQRKISEDDAYGLMRKTAMDRNKRLSDIAANIVAASELLDAGVGTSTIMEMSTHNQ